MFSEAKVEGKQSSPFPAKPVLDVLLQLSLKNGKQKLRKIICLIPTGTEICSSLKEHELITCGGVESPSCCFPGGSWGVSEI